MGTRMAPSDANLFMAQLEKKLLDNASMKPLIWWRDICCHGEANLEIFIVDLNQAHPTMKFTAEWSSSSIPFLDNHVQLENGQLTTDLHAKPMDTHQYLAANSCHPCHCKEAIPLSQDTALKPCEQRLHAPDNPLVSFTYARNDSYILLLWVCIKASQKDSLHCTTCANKKY